MAKRVAIAHEPSLTKKVPTSRWPTDDQSKERISWRMGDIELDGPWTWSDINLTDVMRVHGFLSEIEKMTWQSACSGGSARVKLVKARGAPADTIKRLVDIKRDDIDDLVQLHLGGLPRIWGVRRGNTCHLLWWDPLHTVWPSTMRHT
jgi:hypothetical protein